MSAIKEKLLEMLEDLDVNDLGEDALLNILRDKLDAQKLVIEQLQKANFVEHEKLTQEWEALRLERSELRRNPNRFIDDDHYFIGGKNVIGAKFIVQIRSGRPSLVTVDRNIQEILPEVSPTEFENAK